jgi:hypothetical protein
MITAIRAFFVVALVAMFAAFFPNLHAATFVVPPDETLIEDSMAIISGTIVAAESRFAESGDIETVFTLRIDEALKGRVALGSLSLVEWGGRIGDVATMMSGAPRYEVGKDYLIFLTANRHGEWTTLHLALGRFERMRTEKGELLVRDTSQVHGWDIHGNEPVEIERYAEPFRKFIRERVAGIKSPAAYFVDGQVRGDATDIRSADVEPNFADYDFDDACQVGAASWTDDAGSDVQYSISASPASGNVKSPGDGEERIIEEDPNEVIAGAFGGSGTVATAFWQVSGSHLFEGQTYDTITGSDVVTQNGVKASSLGQSKFRTTLVHELGHTLGFRHSNQSCTTAVPCTTDAVMNSSVAAFNGDLRPWDIDAVRAVYGSGGDAFDYVTGRRTNTTASFKMAKLEVVCAPASISTQPAAVSNISLGATVQLTVTAAGSSPLSYQWYDGVSPDTTTPIPGATTNKLNVTPQSAGTYNLWVRVSNTCEGGSSVNSNTATINVTCANPAIAANPTSVTITQGQSTQLQVTATGSSLTYQWYKGESGDASNPVGTNSNKLTISPSETTKYWVRVSGACGSPVNSAAATVTVVACAEITVNAPTATQLPGIGNFSISVSATTTANPLTYTWFRGGTPGFGGTSLGPGQTKTVNVTTATNFWARIQNTCGRVEFSSVLTLASCTLPSITTQPSDQTINSGQTANLSIAFSAGATVKWYRGVVGDRTTEVGSAANVSVGPLTVTTQFWAEVSNACGAVPSQQVTVTVRELAELVPMLNGRFFVQVRYVNQFDNGAQGKLLGRSLFSTALSESAVFTFGDANVIELMVRVSDARPFDDHIHVFLGGLSDVEFFVVVTDSLTGIVHEYHKPANQLIGALDRTTFPASSGLGSGVDALMARTAALHVTPNAESSTIFLLNNRFEVRMRYRNQFTNPPGEGYMNARSIASSPTTETAVFFFDENVGSAEWMVRFSDARPFANRIDLFHGGLSDVEFTIEVHDTQTGLRKEYHKPPFSLLGQVDRDSYQP